MLNFMKKRLILATVALVTLGSLAIADVQSPPGHQFGWSRKLSRALANLAYGGTEIFVTWQRSARSGGANQAGPDAVVEGTKRTLVRVGYGLFELTTFPVPAYKHTYRPPYYKKERIDPWYGYTEFPPQVGITTQAGYGRTQSW